MRKFVFVASSFLFLAVLALGGGRAAQAADLDWRSDRSLKDEPIIVPRHRFSWTGFYLGGNLGYAWGDTSTYSGDGGFEGATDGFVIHPSGWAGGIQGGYNWQFDNFLFGIEGDLGYLGVDDRESTATAFAETEYGGYGALTARLGYAEDRWLFYLKGGLALANIENRAGAINAGVVDAADLTELDDTRLGWTLGGGVEYAFHPNWSMKFEYMYMDFGDDNSTNIDGDGFNHDNDLHSIKVGVNYRFLPMLEPLR
jgi:outer membrane immunogenic protein